MLIIYNKSEWMGSYARPLSGFSVQECLVLPRKQAMLSLLHILTEVKADSGGVIRENRLKVPNSLTKDCDVDNNVSIEARSQHISRDTWLETIWCFVGKFCPETEIRKRTDIFSIIHHQINEKLKHSRDLDLCTTCKLIWIDKVVVVRKEQWMWLFASLPCGTAHFGQCCSLSSVIWGK